MESARSDLLIVKDVIEQLHGGKMPKKYYLDYTKVMACVSIVIFGILVPILLPLAAIMHWSRPTSEFNNVRFAFEEISNSPTCADIVNFAFFGGISILLGLGLICLPVVSFSVLNSTNDDEHLKHALVQARYVQNFTMGVASLQLLYAVHSPRFCKLNAIFLLFQIIATYCTHKMYAGLWRSKLQGNNKY